MVKKAPVELCSSRGFVLLRKAPVNRVQRLLSGASERRFNIENPNVSLDGLATYMIGLPSEAGVIVNQETSLALSAVWRAVTMRAGGAASLPIKTYVAGPNGTRNDTTSNYPVLADPSVDMTDFEFYEMLHMHLDLWGNFYAYKVYDGDKVRYMEPLLPERCKPFIEWDPEALRMRKLFRVQVVMGGTLTSVVLSPREIFHVMGPSLNGYEGLSAIKYARQSMGLAIAAEVYGAKFFGSGALMAGMLTTDKPLDEGKANTLKDRFQSAYMGINKAHEVAVLDSGAKFQPMSIPPEDAQFLDTRRFGVTEIARWFHVPPFLLMETEKSTSWGSGLEQQDLAYIKHGLVFGLNRIAARIRKDLLEGGEKAEHDLNAILRADISTRFKAYKDAVEIGAMSRADVRRRENESVDDPRLEEYFQPQNVFTIDQIETKQASEIAQQEATTEKIKNPPEPTPVAPNAADPEAGDSPESEAPPAK